MKRSAAKLARVKIWTGSSRSLTTVVILSAAAFALVVWLAVSGRLATPVAVAILVPLQSIFTVAASLLAVDISMRNQTLRDDEAAKRATETARAERIRTAYTLLIRAADRIAAAVQEHIAFPKGRVEADPKHPGVISARIGPPLRTFDTFNRLMEEAQRFYIEGEVTLILEEGPDSAGVTRFGAVWDAYYLAVNEEDKRRLGFISEQLAEAIRDFRSFAHRAVRSLETPPSLGGSLGGSPPALNSK